MSTLGEGFTVANGTVKIMGKSPDGDSIRFIPDDLDTLRGLPNGDRIRPSADGSVQLRLDAIDAPETHYAGAHQPFADAARDELVAFAGFTGVRYGPSGTVTAADDPQERTAMIAAKLVETHGRPVSYLFTNVRRLDPPPTWAEGETVALDEVRVAQTVNAHMIASGRAYTTLYTSTPPALRKWFTDLSRTTDTTGQNVWADDHSGGFDLIDRDSVGEGGVLILPKLFRRVTDYLAARAHGFAGGFDEWLPTATSGGLSEDDLVEIDGRRIAFSDLIRVQGTKIALDADLRELVFVEK